MTRFIGYWKAIYTKLDGMTGRLLVNAAGLVILFSSFSCSPKDDTMFTELEPDDTGIEFRNDIRENEHTNALAYEYTYNGGGVAIGDINNDGLDDVFFTANQKANRLYLNKGNFKFEDITEKAGLVTNRYSFPP